MTSKEINEKILALENSQPHIYECFGGKVFPYLGWYWREVNFDKKEMSFGVLPEGRVGFMQNNKWDYDYVFADERQWSEIKSAIAAALENPTIPLLGRVNSLVQLLNKKKWPDEKYKEPAIIKKTKSQKEVKEFFMHKIQHMNIVQLQGLVDHFYELRVAFEGGPDGGFVYEIEEGWDDPFECDRICTINKDGSLTYSPLTERIDTA